MLVQSESSEELHLPELRFFDFLAESSACDSSAIIGDMATPSAIEIGNLTGKWIIDKRHSTDPEAGLKMGTPNDQNEKMPGVGLHLEILQVPTGGLAQIPESRILDDNQSTLLKDFLFGTRRSDNQLIRGTEGPHSRLVPNLTLKTPIQNIETGQHVRGEINQNGADGGGFIIEGIGLWIHSFDERQDGA
ncbi:uncharacterized protein N7458_005585 [Penicillium daleae]|uniref:Uncharacterized protein n=1 Tax=Penicillium daleae TaxID=63821 RepID=A0AAD6G4W8_9EURO|nr:uncharacterized protein N7458_005585 [Penicillium daleae]KAJ5454629.1 hypothetical protein N7458_005585 [Penicillium daleae]